jgi:SpoVK/Ycf46/Vps4 family AAA+-type ATPase
LKGPPGTGKTVIAEYLALKIRKKGIKELSFADFGSHIPGENSRQIRKVFADAKDNGEMTVVLDECEAVLWDRSRAGSTAMWMLEVIDELLVQIGKYTGLVILISNKAELLDSGLYRRLIAVIDVLPPELPERIRLWQSKFPDSHPLKLTVDQIKEIATLQLTGAEIENVLIEYSSECIRKGTKPKYNGLWDAAAEFVERKKELEAEREEANKSTTRE